MRTLSRVHLEQQRYWIALLNLQRGWSSDEAAVGFIPPRHRDFADPPGWPKRKALIYLHNNLELLRESWTRLEQGEPLDYDLLNHGLDGLRLTLHPWTDLDARDRAARAKEELGGRLESLQVRGTGGPFNAGTEYIRASVQRSLYYFADYVDARLSDPAYPSVTPGRWHVAPAANGGGDLELVRKEAPRART